MKLILTLLLRWTILLQDHKCSLILEVVNEGVKCYSQTHSHLHTHAHTLHTHSVAKPGWRPLGGTMVLE